jgi:hypothetical protein
MAIYWNWSQFIKNVTNLLLRTGLHIYSITVYQNPSLVRYRTLLLLDWSFNITFNFSCDSHASLKMFISKTCSSSWFGVLHWAGNCSQRQTLPNTEVTKACFLISGNYSSHRQHSITKSARRPHKTHRRAACWEPLTYADPKASFRLRALIARKSELYQCRWQYRTSVKVCSCHIRSLDVDIPECDKELQSLDMYKHHVIQ